MSTTERTEVEKKKKDRSTISAVLFSDLSALDPDFTKKLQSGSIKCAVCGRDVREAGLSAVKEQNGRLVWCCSDYRCSDAF